MKLSYEYKRRLKSNQYAYTTAFKRLKRSVEENENKEIYSAIGELLLWVMTTHEWHKAHGASDYLERVKKDKKGALLFGLAHAYNSMKHNMELFTIHNKEGLSFRHFSFSEVDFRPFKISWINVANVLDQGLENQKRNYIKYIQGKEVLETFDNVIIFLNKENNRLYFEQE